MPLLNPISAVRGCAEASPTPVKTVLAAMGQMDARVRLPLAPLTPAGREAVLDAYAPFVEAALARA